MKETKIFLTDEEDILLEWISEKSLQSKTKYCTALVKKNLESIKSDYELSSNEE